MPPYKIITSVEEQFYFSLLKSRIIESFKSKIKLEHNPNTPLATQTLFQSENRYQLAHLERRYL